MGDVETGSQSTRPLNAEVDPTVTMLLKGLRGTYGDSAAAFDNLSPEAAATTRSGWESILSAANNPTYSGAINSAIGEFGDIASGNRFGDGDAQWNAVRDNLATDIMSRTNAGFNNSGLFGSDSNQRAVGEGLASGLGGLDLARLQSNEARQERAATYIPALFNAGLSPGAAISGVGDSMVNAGWGPLQQASSVLGVTSGAGGTQSSSSIPWWQALLGGASTVAGLAGG